MLAMVWVQGRTVAVYVCATWMLLVREQRGLVCERTGRRRDSGRERDGGRERGREVPSWRSNACSTALRRATLCDNGELAPTFRLASVRHLLNSMACHGTYQTGQHNSSRAISR